MARDFIKLDGMIAEDEHLAFILETNPLAAAFFSWALPACDCYGILPGSARKFLARVAPLAQIDHTLVEAAIVALCAPTAQGRPGPWHRYEVDGELWLYVRRYNKWQTVGWARVSEPKHPLPDCWNVPDDLAEFVALTGLTDKRSIRVQSLLRPLVERHANLTCHSDRSQLTRTLERREETRENGVAREDDGGNGADHEWTATATAMQAGAGRADPNDPDLQLLWEGRGDVDGATKIKFHRAVVVKANDLGAREGMGAATPTDALRRIVARMCFLGFAHSEPPTIQVSDAWRSLRDEYKALQEAH